MLRKSEIFIEDLGFQALSLIMNYRVVKYFQNRSLILLMHDFVNFFLPYCLTDMDLLLLPQKKMFIMLQRW